MDYSEIYDTKTLNTRIRPKIYSGKCDECKEFNGHDVTCSKVTVEGIAKLLRVSRISEQVTRDRAARWLEQLQRLTGKLAILKHENNKLRRENEFLRGKRRADSCVTEPLPPATPPDAKPKAP